jgi:hypothetical protein
MRKPKQQMFKLKGKEDNALFANLLLSALLLRQAEGRLEKHYPNSKLVVSLREQASTNLDLLGTSNND